MLTKLKLFWFFTIFFNFFLDEQSYFDPSNTDNFTELVTQPVSLTIFWKKSFDS